MIKIKFILVVVAWLIVIWHVYLKTYGKIHLIRNKAEYHRFHWKQKLLKSSNALQFYGLVSGLDSLLKDSGSDSENVWTRESESSPVDSLYLTLRCQINKKEPSFL